MTLRYIPSVHVAHPYGFSHSGSDFFRKTIKPDLGKIGFKVRDSFGLIHWEPFSDAYGRLVGEEQDERLKELGRSAAGVRLKSIDESSIVLAVLDGSDVDSGVAVELQHAVERDKRVIGYRGDTRIAAENKSWCVNLQVFHAIESSGGRIYHHWGDVRLAMSFWYDRIIGRNLAADIAQK